MKFAIVFFLSLFTGVYCFSQTSQDDGKWEIGLNVLPLFDSSFYVVESSSTLVHPTEALSSYLLVRRRIGETLKLRGSAGLRIENTTFRPDDRPETLLLANSVQGFSLSLGAEKYVKTGRLSVYFGGGLSGYYLKSIFKKEIDTRPDAHPPTILKLKDVFIERQYGLDGLAGVNVKIISGLYISVESSFLAGYREANTDYKQYEGENLLLTTVGDGTRKRYIANLRPISAVQIIYQF